MTTKDLPDNPNVNFDKTSKGQFSNLYLNQRYECFNVFPVQSKIVTKDNKTVTSPESFDCDNSKTNQDSHSWKKSNKYLSASVLNINNGEKDKFKKSSNITNSSTLSLHIAAYENATEATNEASLDVKRLTNITQKCDSLSIILNPFEFPRQQNDKLTEPEIMQFTTSQKLLDPNLRISRIEHSKFYNSLTDEQKLNFKKYEEEHKQMKNELLKTNMQLREERRKIEELQSGRLIEVEQEESQDLTEDILQNEPKSLNFKEAIPFGTVLTNSLFYELLHSITERQERRKKVLEFYGLESRANDQTILPPKYLDYFEENFVQKRKSAGKNKKLSAFNQEKIFFPRDKLPLANEEHSLESTVANEFSTDDSEMIDDNYYNDMPVLQEMDMTKPLPKKRRLETFATSFPITAEFATQTDLKMKHLSDLEEVGTKLKNLKDKFRYHKKKSEALKEQNNNFENLVVELENECNELDEEVSQLKLLREQIIKLKEEVHDRERIITELREEQNEGEDTKIVQLKDSSGKFTIAAQGSFGQLITQCSLAHDKVPKAIKIVADLFKVQVNSLPSRWTVDRSLNFVHGMNCEHIVKVFSGCSSKSVLTDETKKFNKQINAVAIAGKNDQTHETFTLYIGGRQVPDKSALRTFEELEDMLKEVAKMCGLSEEPFWQTFVVDTRSTISDEASTEKLFAKVFFAYRKSVIDSFTHLDEQTKAKLERVHTFFCRLHMLSNTTPHVLAVFLEHEKEITENHELQASSVDWAVKTFAKKFGKRSSAKHGSAGEWEAYADKKELKYHKIDSFLGHRFAIFYKIALEIIYNRIHLIDFLEHYAGDDEILIALKHALNNEMLVLHLHLLALLDILIISPFWRFSENCESVLETRNVAIPLIHFLKRLIDEPMVLFLGESPFDAFPASFPITKKGKEFETALKQMPAPMGASEIIPLIAQNLLNYFEKKLEPFVTGDYAFPDMAMEKETAGAPCTNRAIESFFGVVDHLTDVSPNMTTYNISIKAVAIKNKVYDYVSSLPENEREELYEKAYKTMNLSAKLAAEKKKHIHRELIDKMEKKALEKAKEKSKIQKKKHKLATEIELCGFWRTTAAMDRAIKDKPPKDVKAWVKSNIQFRKVIWSPSYEPKWLMQFSHKGRTFTCNELIYNLTRLIESDPPRELVEETEEDD